MDRRARPIFRRILGLEVRELGDAITAQMLRASMSPSENPSQHMPRSATEDGPPLEWGLEGTREVNQETVELPRKSPAAQQTEASQGVGVEIPDRPDWFPPPKLREAVDAPWTFLWFSSGDIAVCGLLIAALLGAMGFRWGWGIWSDGEAIRVEHVVQGDLTHQIDVNRATWGEFTLLEGIGPSLAREIVEDREKHGVFRQVDDLDRVPGIGEKTLNRIRKHLRVGPPVLEGKPSRRRDWRVR